MKSSTKSSLTINDVLTTVTDDDLIAVFGGSCGCGDGGGGAGGGYGGSYGGGGSGGASGGFGGSNGAGGSYPNGSGHQVDSPSLNEWISFYKEIKDLIP